MDPRSTRSSSAHDLVVIGAGIVGLACAWRAAQAGPVGAGGRARRAGRRRVGRGRGDAGAGHRGRLRRGGAAGAQPGGPRAVAGLRRRAGGASPACPPATPTRARWWWRPTATTPRSLRRLHDYQRDLRPRVRVARAHARRARWSRGSRRASAGPSSRPRTATPSPGAVVAALAQALESAGGELRTGVEVDGLLDRRRRGDRGAHGRGRGAARRARCWWPRAPGAPRAGWPRRPSAPAGAGR